MNEERFIFVNPKNYRSISLLAIEISSEPHVYIDKKEVFDFTDQGKLTQKGIRNCINFEIKDGSESILGFHDHPSEMWVTEKYNDFAKICENNGWLKIDGV